MSIKKKMNPEGLKMFKEFKEFAMKGNVIDLATGVIIGAAFGKIVSSLVNDIIMPLLSLLTGGVTKGLNFASLFIALDGKEYATIEAAKANGVATFNYGLFITSVIDFLIIAFAIFIIIKQINRFKPKTVAEPTTKTCPFCQSTIHLKAVKCPNCTSDVK